MRFFTAKNKTSFNSSKNPVLFHKHIFSNKIFYYSARAIEVFKKIVMSDITCDKITEFLISVCACDINDTKVDVCTMSEKTPLLSFHADKVSR